MKSCLQISYKVKCFPLNYNLSEHFKNFIVGVGGHEPAVKYMPCIYESLDSIPSSLCACVFHFVHQCPSWHHQEVTGLLPHPTTKKIAWSQNNDLTLPALKKYTTIGLKFIIKRKLIGQIRLKVRAFALHVAKAQQLL